MKKFIESYASWIALILLLILCAATCESFRIPANYAVMLRQACYTGIIAVGMTFVIGAGGIDLSVGSLFALRHCIQAGALLLHLSGGAIRCPDRHCPCGRGRRRRPQRCVGRFCKTSAFHRDTGYHVHLPFSGPLSGRCRQSGVEQSALEHA